MEKWANGEVRKTTHRRSINAPSADVSTSQDQELKKTRKKLGKIELFKPMIKRLHEVMFIFAKHT